MLTNTGVNGLELDILTCGTIPPNPSELLGSKKMKDFLADCQLKYDVILIDTPPICVVTDSAILAALCDGTIFVVASGEAQIQQAIQAKEQLDIVGAKILGVVMNKVKVPNRNYGVYDNYYSSASKQVSLDKEKP